MCNVNLEYMLLKQMRVLERLKTTRARVVALRLYRKRHMSDFLDSLEADLASENKFQVFICADCKQKEQDIHAKTVQDVDQSKFMGYPVIKQVCRKCYADSYNYFQFGK